MEVGGMDKVLMCLQISKESHVTRGKCALSRAAIVDVKMDTSFHPERMVIQSHRPHMSR